MILKKDRLRHEIIIAEDIRGRIGRKADDKIVGRFGEDIINDSRE